MTTQLFIEIAGAFICLIIGLVWSSTFLPLLQKLSYHGITIQGRWEILQNKITCDGSELSIERSTIIDLNQVAFRLEGTAISNAIIDGRSDVINYKVKGEIKDRFLSLTFYNIDNTRMAYSVFLMEITNNGQTMIGYRVFYALLASKINSVSCSFKRVL